MAPRRRSSAVGLESVGPSPDGGDVARGDAATAADQLHARGPPLLGVLDELVVRRVRCPAVALPFAALWIRTSVQQFGKRERCHR